jgi:glutamyl-Q tRNA(Asp) synthetase
LTQPSTQAPAYRGRFAPSPTGPLHLGSLTTALGSWLIARQHGGRWLVRIEDLDPPRERPGMADQHLRDLSAFGMDSDEPVLRQSERSEHYVRALDRLKAGGWAFECRCSRGDLAGHGGLHLQCVDQPSGQEPAWRVRLPRERLGFHDALRGHFEQDLGREAGDVVVRRADGLWAYQLAVVVDDALQGITEVVRGADLLDSTPRQIALQRLLGLPTPRYVHLPVLRESTGAKLSKSLDAFPVDAARPLPALQAAFGLLGQDTAALLGARSSTDALERALAAFDPGSLPREDRFLAADWPGRGLVP